MDKIYRTSIGVVSEEELLLHEAVITNDAEILRKILKKADRLINVNCRNNYGRAPIHLAASRGNTEILDMLIKAKADIEAKDKFGMRPLHMAVWYGQREAAEMLINKGALVSALDKKHRTLLMMASHSDGSDSFLEYIIEKIDPAVEARLQDSEGATALHHAARFGHPEAIDTLVKMMPNLDLDFRDHHGQTALHYACAAGHQEAAIRLANLGASLGVQDSESCTALHLAARSRESRLCARLLESCGSPSELARLLRLSEHRGYNLLHVAASLGCCLLLRSLLELDPRPSEALNSRCQRGDTALHLAARDNQAQAVELLIECGAPVEAVNHEMQTALQLARELGHSEVCRVLVSASSSGAGTGSSARSSSSGLQETESDEKEALHSAAKTSLASIANIIARTARLDYPALFLRGTRALFNSSHD